jgi:hypothetical protein
VSVVDGVPAGAREQLEDEVREELEDAVQDESS